MLQKKHLTFFPEIKIQSKLAIRYFYNFLISLHFLCRQKIYYKKLIHYCKSAINSLQKQLISLKNHHANQMT